MPLEAVVSFVAALLEGRNFVGIERNRETELFRNEKIDYVVSATERFWGG